MSNKKWILVTGASSGIGEETVKYLDKCGYNTVLVARSTEKMKEISGRLKESSFVITLDLNDLQGIESIFENINNQGIKLDGLVHCAGIGYNSPVKNNDINIMQAIMTTNYFSFMEMGKYFSKKKYTNDGSSIVAVSSISPLTCYTAAGNYAASKSAVNTVVKIMAKEFIKRRIRVNAVLPAMVKTQLGVMNNDPEYVAKQPLGIIDKEQVAYLIEFLLSDKSLFMTGTLVPISAGMSY